MSSPKPLRRRSSGPPPSFERPRLLATVFSRASLSKCAPIALVVGTVLSLVNQGSVLFAGAATTGTWLRVAVNYLVPFCVSSAGFYGARRSGP